MGERVQVEDLASYDDLPDAARALFGANAYATPAWYRSAVAAGLPEGERPCFQMVSRGGVVLAVVPMALSANGYRAMTTPYTVLWSPLLGEQPDEAIEALGLALGRVWRRWPATRLDALDGDARWVAPLLRGARRAGLVPLRFDHFGNWHTDVAGQGWDAYLATRPGATRSAVVRRSKALTGRLGARLELVADVAEVESGIAAYERVYAASWKEPEPQPGFCPALMRAAAHAGTLRLGLLWLGDVPIAAQFWLLHPGPSGCWAGVQKLAHDEAHKRHAPGTVLTALMLRHLLDIDRVAALDFGRGDDAYKASWTGERWQRTGLVLATPLRLAGARAIATHWAGQIRRRGRRSRTAPMTSFFNVGVTLSLPAIKASNPAFATTAGSSSFAVPAFVSIISARLKKFVSVMLGISTVTLTPVSLSSSRSASPNQRRNTLVAP